ncbi:MAG: isoprenylcysteine carboxylmethyltransferase family protein [Candidatus Cloacimonetes bacterium]|nr:isoprenylcysteine carboxylmethyltransferase family protein [Candidatus Cloacimonadota bacterium]
MHNWKNYIPSSLAGLLTLTQFILLFFISKTYIPSLRYVGYAIWALSAYFGWAPMVIFKKKGGVTKGRSYLHTTKLVDTGVYAIVRHSQYVALPLLNIAFILVGQNLIIAILGIVAIPLMLIDIQKADKTCLKKFGEIYNDYMKRVPRINFVLGIIRVLSKKDNVRT